MGIGFAIPVNMVKGVIATAKAGGAVVKRPYLGAKLQDVTRDIADSLGLDRPIGAAVASLEAGSPAADAGLKRGDVIVAVDGQAVDDSAGVDFRIGVKPIGGVASLTLMRAGKTVIVADEAERAAGNDAAQRGAAVEPLAAEGRAGDEPVAGGDRRTLARRQRARRRRRASSSPTSPRIRPRRSSACRRATSSSASTARRFATRTASSRRPLSRAAAGISPSPAPAR